MSFYEKLFKNRLFPFYESVLKNRQTINYLNEYTANENASKEDIDNIQLRKLSDLLQHCIDNVPYYRKAWAELGFHNASDFKSMDDFMSLPTLTKDIIRANQDDLIATNNLGKTLKKHTSGSTGVPMRLELNTESEERRQAVMWRGYGIIGAGLGVKTIYLWGGTISPDGFISELKQSLYHGFFNRKLLNSHKMTQENMPEYIEQINNYKADAMVAFVNPLYELSIYINKNNIKVESPKSIITGAEGLHEHQRVEIEKAFKCKVFSTFGCRETMLIASECEGQNGFHLNNDHLVVEVVDEKTGKPTDGIGELRITDLHNYRMPLIRYANGDMAIMSKETSCPCGNEMPKLEKIVGRKLDMLRSPNGNIIPGEFFTHMLMSVKGVESYQVIQNELSIISFNFIVNSSYEKDKEENEISETMKRFSNGSLSSMFVYPEELQKTDAGKFRLTIFNVKD